MLFNPINAMRHHALRPLSTHSCDIVLPTAGGLPHFCSGHPSSVPEVWLLWLTFASASKRGHSLYHLRIIIFSPITNTCKNSVRVQTL